MSYIDELNLEAFKLIFKQIIDIDECLISKKNNITNEIEKLKQTHTSLIKENNKKIFIFCLDSFYFLYRILYQEMEDLSKFIVILNNRMYGEYYKLYNIIVSQLTERNIILQNISQHKKYPVYKDLEQLREYSINEISDIHETILNTLSELYNYYITKQQTIKDYSHKNNINISITNFIHTLEYENTLIREQICLYVSYLNFFYSTQKKYLDKLHKRFVNFESDVLENITNNENSQFIESICNTNDIIKTPLSSLKNITSSNCSSDLIDLLQLNEITTLSDSSVIKAELDSTINAENVLTGEDLKYPPTV